jgi:hypothetical protein
MVFTMFLMICRFKLLGKNRIFFSVKGKYVIN